MRILKTQDWFHRDGFPIAVERRDPQEPFGRHSHEFAELVIVNGGRARHVLGSESWTLSAGDVFLISGRRAHEYRQVNRYRPSGDLDRPHPDRNGHRATQDTGGSSGSR